MSLSDRIKAKQLEIVQLQDTIEEINNSPAEDLSEEQTLLLAEATDRLEKAKESLEVLERTEETLARKTSRSQQGTDGKPAQDKGGSPRIELLDNKPKGHRAVAVMASIVKALGLRQDPVSIAKEVYKDQSEIELLVRAATAPATTAGSTWATNLMQEVWGEFIELLRDVSVYGQIPGLRIDLTNTTNFPVQAGRGNLAAGFVAENGAIKVVEGSIGTTSLTPFKLGVISAYTKELARRSMPNVEQIVRTQMLGDTAEAIDTALLDATARGSTRPAGLQDTTGTGAANVNAVTNAATGAHGSTVAEMVADVDALLARAEAIKETQGVWVMNPAQVRGIRNKQDATTGEFVFRDEINQGRFEGYPIITSSNVTGGIIAWVGNNSMAFGMEMGPTFELSDQATLHFEGASPLAIGTAGTPNTVAAPVYSLFQQDLFAVKMLMGLDWRITRQAGVQVLTGATGW